MIDRMSFQEIIFQYLVCPDTELCASLRFNAITNRYNDIEAIEICLVFFTICCSCQVFLDNWISLKFTFFKNVIDVKTNILLWSIKKLKHLGLRKPNGIFFDPHFNLEVRVACLFFVDDYFSFSHWWFEHSKIWGLFAYGGIWRFEDLKIRRSNLQTCLPLAD